MSDKDWIEQFPGLGPIEERTRARLIERSRVVSVPKGTVIFGPGKAPESMLLLIEGTVRVQEISESGREIVLYRVSRGESCVLTTACLLADEGPVNLTCTSPAGTQSQSCLRCRRHDLPFRHRLVAESPKCAARDEVTMDVE